MICKMLPLLTSVLLMSAPPNGLRITGEGLRGTMMDDSDDAREEQRQSGQTDLAFVRCMRLICRRLLRSFTLGSSPARGSALQLCTPGSLRPRSIPKQPCRYEPQRGEEPIHDQDLDYGAIRILVHSGDQRDHGGQRRLPLWPITATVQLDVWASNPIYLSIGVLLPCWGNLLV